MGELALHHKRCGEWAAALALWDRWIDPLPWAIAPLVEKAMYYEWIVGQPGEALTCCAEALRRAAALPLGTSARGLEDELHHREERLMRRLSGVAKASEDGVACADQHPMRPRRA